MRDPLYLIKMSAARDGLALPDGSYMARDRHELIQAFADIDCEPVGVDRTIVQNHLIRRALALKSLDLVPDDWRIQP
jgi:hypothetical protein